MGNCDVSDFKNPHRFSSTNQPRNPDGSHKGGRKKGMPNFSTVFKRYLKQIVELKKGKGSEETFSVTAQEAIVIKAIEQAIRNADVKTIEMIMNRVDGLPTQAIKNMGKNPLQIMFSPAKKEELENKDNFETNIKEDKEETYLSDGK